jgi:uncharacterized tellurite resistance protein B-like protein
MNAQLSELKNNILADGKIDVEEVSAIQDVLFADGKIDQEEADFLFELNNAVSGNSNDPSWQSLFVEAIAGFLLNDATTPNEIDITEAEWLLEKLQGDGQIDATEKALLARLAAQATTMPESLRAFIQANS